MKTSDSVTPERIFSVVTIIEQNTPRHWIGETLIGKKINVFRHHDANFAVPEVGDRVEVEFHPFEMSRAKIIGFEDA